MKEMNSQAKSKKNTKSPHAFRTPKRTVAAPKRTAVSFKHASKKSSRTVLMPEKLDIANTFLKGLTIPV